MADDVNNKGWRIWQMNEWWRTQAVKPRPRWLLQGLLPAESICWVSGPPKKGFKTWTTFAMAQALASGRPYKFFRPLQPVPVLIVEEEGNTIDTLSRWRKVELGCFGVDGWNENMYDDRLHWLHHSMMKVDDPAHIRMVGEYVVEHGIKVVVLDALTKMVMGDENSFRDARAVCDNVDYLRNLGCTVIGIRHISKDFSRPDTDVDDPDIGMRGHSVYRDVYDVHMAMLRNPRVDRILMETRYRDHPWAEYNLRWSIENCPEDEHDPINVTACERRECDHACSLLTCMHKATLNMTRRGKDDEIVELFEAKIRGKFRVGVINTMTDMQQALGGKKKWPVTKALEVRAKMLDADLIMSPPNGDGFIVK
jgi:hypothetical protein